MAWWRISWPARSGRASGAAFGSVVARAAADGDQRLVELETQAPRVDGRRVEEGQQALDTIVLGQDAGDEARDQGDVVVLGDPTDQRLDEPARSQEADAAAAAAP